MDNNTPVISAKNLNLWYGDFKALKSISLDVGNEKSSLLTKSENFHCIKKYRYSFF